MSKVQIVNYTEKSIAVFGVDSTSGVLQALGGKFNSNLRGKPGWIFPKMNESVVRTALTSSGSTLRSEPMKEEDQEDVPRPPKRLLQRASSEPKDEVIIRLERIEKLLQQLVNRS